MPSLIINEAKALNDNVTTVYTHAIMKRNFLDSLARLTSTEKLLTRDRD